MIWLGGIYRWCAWAKARTITNLRRFDVTGKVQRIGNVARGLALAALRTQMTLHQLRALG